MPRFSLPFCLTKSVKQSTPCPDTGIVCNVLLSSPILYLMYEYRMVQIPVNVVADAGAHGKAGVYYMQQLVNFGAEKGWEFYRIDTLGIPQHEMSCQVITFRREAAPPVHPTVEPRHQPHFQVPEAPVSDSGEPVEEKPWWR